MSLFYLDAGGWTNAPQMAKDEGFDGIRTEVSASSTHEQVVRNALALGLKVCFLWNSTDVQRGIDRYKALGCNRQNAPRFELINEPGLNGMSGAAYGALLKTARGLLDKNFAQGEAPDLAASADGGHADPSGNDYLTQWWGIAGLVVDCTTVHPYGGSQKQYGGFALNRQRMLDVRARTGKPVIASECGLTTGTSGTPDSAAATEDQQMGSTTGPAPSGQPGTGSGLLGIVQFAHDNDFDVSIFAAIDQVQSGSRMYGMWHHDGSHAPKRVVGPMKALLASLKGDTPPDPPPTPVPLAAITIVSPTTTQLSGQVKWAVATSANVTMVVFSIDGTWEWVETFAPWVFNGDAGLLDTTTLTDGPHVLSVAATNPGGTSTVDLNVIVNNAPAPPPPAPVVNGGDWRQLSSQIDGALFKGCDVTLDTTGDGRKALRWSKTLPDGTVVQLGRIRNTDDGWRATFAKLGL